MSLPSLPRMGCDDDALLDGKASGANATPATSQSKAARNIWQPSQAFPRSMRGWVRGWAWGGEALFGRVAVGMAAGRNVQC